MTVSIVTVVFNNEKFIEGCLDSVQSQTYPKLEHIIVDGGSTDHTLEIIRRKSNEQLIIVSEADLGYYDALNKGIKLCKGSIIGMLNSDDEYASRDVISNVAARFKEGLFEAVYGNLNYISRIKSTLIRREWREKRYDIRRFKYGWMPAHPTLFLKKRLFLAYGYYSLDLGTCADYDLILRFLYLSRVKAVFLNELLVLMKAGGISNGSVNKRYGGLKNDYKILKSNGFHFPLVVVMLKKLRKLRQFSGL